MNLQRVAARSFVIGGGAFWAFAALFAPYGNRTVSLLGSAVNSAALLGLTAAVFLLGYFYERLAALLLLLATATVGVYGVVSGWEPGAWMLVGVVLILPMLMAGLLFWSAARMQDTCELDEANAGRPDPAV